MPGEQMDDSERMTKSSQPAILEAQLQPVRQFANTHFQGLLTGGTTTCSLVGGSASQLDQTRPEPMTLSDLT